MIAVSVIGVVIIALIVLLVSGGGGGGSTTGTTTSASTHGHKSSTGHHAPATSTHHAASTAPVALSLRATAVVYVCLLGENGRKLIPGIELQPGETTPTYHAKRFVITLGNSSVTMFVDGTPRTVAPSSQAIGYSITKALGRKSLVAGPAADVQVSARPSVDGPPRAGHRRDRHRGADRQGQRSQRTMARRAPTRARRRAGLHDRRRRSPRGHAHGARVHGRARHRADPHQRRPRTDRRRPHGGGRRRLPGPRDGARRGPVRADRTDRAPADETLAQHRPRGDRRGQSQAGDDPARRDRARAGRDGARTGGAGER